MNQHETSKPLPRSFTALALAFAVLALGCSDAGEESATGGDGTDPVYAVMSQVFDAEGDRLVYVQLTKSLDFDGISLDSAWDYTPLFALYGVGPAPCVARVTPDGQLDTDFETDLTSLTGGRHLMNFRYVRDGWGFADVLHHELLDADFAGPLDPAVLEQIWAGGAFKLWRIDLANGSAEPYEDVGEIGMGWRTQVVDERTFLFIPSPDWSSTIVFELDAAGAATRLLEAQGDVSWLRVR